MRPETRLATLVNICKMLSEHWADHALIINADDPRAAIALANVALELSVLANAHYKDVLDSADAVFMRNFAAALTARVRTNPRIPIQSQADQLFYEVIEAMRSGE